MGWFARAFSTIKDKVKNAAPRIFNKVKKGWNVAGQVAGYTHSHIMPKLKWGLRMASMVPALEEFALPALAGVEAADAALGQGLAIKGQIDRQIEKFQSKQKVNVQPQTTTTQRNTAIFH